MEMLIGRWWQRVFVDLGFYDLTYSITRLIFMTTDTDSAIDWDTLSYSLRRQHPTMFVLVGRFL